MIPEIETADPATIRAFQEEKLQVQLAYLQQHSPYYQKLFKHHQIDINKITRLEDLQYLPVTIKKDLQQYNFEFLCVPRNQVADYVTTSGTMGEPVTLALSSKDLDRLAYNEAISLACCGINSESTVQLMTTIDRRFMAGLAYFLGLQKLGAAVVRVGNSIPELQWDSIQRFQPDYLIAVPSFLLKLIDYAQKHQIDYQSFPLKGIVCIGESLRDAELKPSQLTQKIQSLWEVPLYSTYASTEMGTAFTECAHFSGGHHHPELIIIEILDENDRPVCEGQPGELTITHLGIEAMPLLRFKTGDIVTAYSDPCPCGRNTQRIGPVLGRKEQLIKFKGTSVYPPALIDILHNWPGIDLYVIEVTHNELGTDQITLKIATPTPTVAFQQEIEARFRAQVRVTPVIEWHTAETLYPLVYPPMSRKPRTFIDHRVTT